MQPLRKIWEELPKASKKNRMAKVECLLEQDMAKPLDLFGDFLLNYWMLKSNLWKSLFINLIFCFKLVITTMIRNPRKGKSFFAKDRRFSSCSDMFQHWRRKHFSALRDVPTFRGGPVLCYPETHFHCYHWVKICRIPKELDPTPPQMLLTWCASFLSIAFRGPVKTPDVSTIYLSFSKSCHLKLENQPSDLNLGSMNYTRDVVFPLVGTAVMPLVDDLGRHWYCGKEGMTSAFEETLRCILVHSCHASCQIKGPTGTNCKKKHGWDLVCARQMFMLCLWFAICEGYIRYSDFPMIFEWFSIIFQFSHEIPVLSAGLPPSIVAYAWNASCQKLEILKKDSEQLHRMWQEVFDEISSKYCEAWIKSVVFFASDLNKKYSGLADCLSSHLKNLVCSQISNGWPNAMSSRCQPDLPWDVLVSVSQTKFFADRQRVSKCPSVQVFPESTEKKPLGCAVDGCWRRQGWCFLYLICIPQNVLPGILKSFPARWARCQPTFLAVGASAFGFEGPNKGRNPRSPSARHGW